MVPRPLPILRWTPTSSCAVHLGRRYVCGAGKGRVSISESISKHFWSPCCVRLGWTLGLKMDWPAWP